MLFLPKCAIIGSPPCQAFSHSNKSGNGDKTLGIQLIEAYLRIIARKKAKPNSALQYWVLENVPAVKDYIKEEYSAKDLGLQGSIVLHPHEGAAGIYNAKYFGAPTNRERYLCGEFPKPQQTHTDKTVVTLRQVLAALGDPASEENDLIYDVNYPGFCMNRKDDIYYCKDGKISENWCFIDLPYWLKEQGLDIFERTVTMGELARMCYRMKDRTAS